MLISTTQKSLARHCLVQASKVYMQDPPICDPEKPFNPAEFAQFSWQLIESQIHQALGRQAYHLGRPDEALTHFLALLAHSEGEESDEGDQGAWDDFKLAYEVRLGVLISSDKVRRLTVANRTWERKLAKFCENRSCCSGIPYSTQKHLNSSLTAPSRTPTLTRMMSWKRPCLNMAFST